MDPYQIGVITLLARVAARLNELGRNPDTRIEYVLDQIDKGLKNVSDGLSADRDWDAYRLRSIRWARNVDVPHLQGADIIAYEMAKKVSSELGRGPVKLRKSLEHLTHGANAAKYGGIHIGPNNLRELLKERARLGPSPWQSHAQRPWKLVLPVAVQPPADSVTVMPTVPLGPPTDHAAAAEPLPSVGGNGAEWLVVLYWTNAEPVAPATGAPAAFLATANTV